MEWRARSVLFLVIWFVVKAYRWAEVLGGEEINNAGSYVTPEVGNEGQE